MSADALMDRLVRRLFWRGWREQAGTVAPIERDAAIVGADRATSDPDHFAAGAQLVEQAGLVAMDAGGQDVAFIRRPGQERAFELGDDLQQPIEAAGLATQAVPAGQKACEGGGRDGLDLAPQACQRASAQRAEYVGVTPLALGATRSELAAQDAAALFQATQRVLDQRSRQTPTLGWIARGERRVRARPTQQQGLERARARLQEDVGNAAWRLYADGIAVARQVLDGDPALFPADARLESAPLRRQPIEPIGRV